MKKQILIIIAVILVISGITKAQTNSKHERDEKAIRQIVQNLADAWAAGDAVKWADQFADDVDFTVWNGMYFNGREANIKGHQQIFDTFYKGTKINPKIRKIRFLRDDVAIVHILPAGNERNDKQLENMPLVSPIMVFSKEKGKWKIVAFQNTPIIKEGDLVIDGNENAKQEK